MCQICYNRNKFEIGLSGILHNDVFFRAHQLILRFIPLERAHSQFYCSGLVFVILLSHYCVFVCARLSLLVFAIIKWRIILFVVVKPLITYAISIVLGCMPQNIVFTCVCVLCLSVFDEKQNGEEEKNPANRSSIKSNGIQNAWVFQCLTHITAQLNSNEFGQI